MSIEEERDQTKSIEVFIDNKKVAEWSTSMSGFEYEAIPAPDDAHKAADIARGEYRFECEITMNTSAWSRFLKRLYRVGKRKHDELHPPRWKRLRRERKQKAKARCERLRKQRMSARR